MKSGKDCVKTCEYANYEKHLHSLWFRIFNLNDSYYILNKIIAFPFSLFSIDNHCFWHYTRTALFERCIMLTWGLVIDCNNGEGLTLGQFKNDIFKTYLIEDELNEFKEKVKELQFDQKINDLKSKIITIRHNFIAHYNYEKAWDNNNITDQDSISIRELKTGLTIINEYFTVLCLGVIYSIHNVKYLPGATIGGKPVLTDIDKLLKNIIVDDPCYSMSDENPQRWHFVKNNIDPIKLELINTVRNDSGLPQIE